MKLHALDFVITILTEHENKIDLIVKELTLLATSLEKSSKRLEKEIESITRERARDYGAREREEMRENQ